MQGQPVFPVLFEILKDAISDKFDAINALVGSGGPGLTDLVAVPSLCSDNSKLVAILTFSLLTRKSTLGIDDNTFSAFQKSFEAASKVKLPHGTADFFQLN